MNRLACSPTVASALGLTLVLMVVMPGRALAFDGSVIGTPAAGTGIPAPGIPGAGALPGGSSGTTGVDRLDPAARTLNQANDPAAASLNEPYRANYFVDYHVDPGNAGTGGTFVDADDPNNLRERVDRKLDESTTRDPFANDLRRFRGEMMPRYR